MANSAFDTLLERNFSGASVSVITAVGGGTGINQWNPSNDAYPFISSSSYRGLLNFNEAIIEQEPDLVILGGISTPANQEGYSAFEQVIAKLQSPSTVSRLGYKPDILIMTGAFGTTWMGWQSSDRINSANADYRSSLLRIANKYNVGFFDLTGSWGEYMMAALASTTPSAIGSTTSLNAYWRDSVHANTSGKQVLGRALTSFLSGFSPDMGNISSVSIAQSTESIAEDTGTGIVYTFTRTGDTTDPLTVYFTVGGTAAAGIDYTGFDAISHRKSITFAAGSNAETITLTPKPDAIFESNETIILALDSTAGKGYVIETDNNLTTSIVNDDILAVAITAISDNLGTIQGVVADGGFTNDNTLIVSGTRSAPLGAGEVLTVFINGIAAGKASFNNTTLSWTFTTAPLNSNGTHTFTAAVVDAAGNRGPLSNSRSIVLDITPPTQSVVISAVLDNTDPQQGLVANGGRTNDTTPTISGTVSAALGEGETLKLYNGSSFLIDAIVDPISLTWSATPTLSTNATYAINARVVDAAGNQGPASSSRSFVLDTLAPTQTAAITSITDNLGTIQGVVADGAFTNDTTPTLSGTLSSALGAGEVLTIFRNGIAAGNASVNNTTLSWTFTTAPLNSNGTHTFTAAVVDAAGNRGPLSSPYQIKLDAGSFETNRWSFDWSTASSLAGTPGLLMAKTQVNSPRNGEPPRPRPFAWCKTRGPNALIRG